MTYRYERCPAGRECWWVSGPGRPMHYHGPEGTIRELVARMNGGKP